MRRAAFTLTEFMLVAAILAALAVLVAAGGPRQAGRLDDRVGLVPLGLVLVWGIGLAARLARTDRLRATLIAGAVALTAAPLGYRRWGMGVKEWLLGSAVDPYFWEALLTLAMSLPMTAAFGLLLWAASRGAERGDRHAEPGAAADRGGM